MRQLPTKSELEQMKNIDVRTVDPDTLVDIRGVCIDPKLPKAERVKQYISQVKNPYCYRYGKFIVKNSFARDGETLESILARYPEDCA
jgi:hypothetical protein